MNRQKHTAANAAHRDFDSDDDWSYAHGETFVRRVLVSPRVLEWLSGHPGRFDHPPQQILAMHDQVDLTMHSNGVFDGMWAVQAVENPFLDSLMGNTLTHPQMTSHDLTELLNLLPGTSAHDFAAPIHPIPSPRLPLPLISHIASLLAAASAYGTLANLNATCWAVHRKTLHPLYEITVWDSSWVLLQTTVERSPGWRVPPGWAYTRYLIVDEDDGRYLRSLIAGNRTWESLFPHLIIYVEKNRLLVVREKEGLVLEGQRRMVDVQVFRPVSVGMYGFVLGGLPIRWETCRRSVMVVQSVEHVRSILFHPRGRIMRSGSVRDIDWRQGAGCLTVTLSPAMMADVGTRETLQSVLQHLTGDPMPVRGVGWNLSRELRVLQCSVEVYILLIDMLYELIPESHGYPCITVSLHSPIFTSFIDAEIAPSRAVKLYVDLWPTMHQRMGDGGAPFFELQGPAFQRLGIGRALIMLDGTSRFGERFVVDVRTAEESVGRYPVYMTPDVPHP